MCWKATFSASSTDQINQSLGIEPWNSHFPKHPRWFLCIFKFESNPFRHLLSSPLFFLTHSSFISYPTRRAHIFTNWQVKLYRLNEQVRIYSNIIGLFTRFFFKSWIIKSQFSDFSFFFTVLYKSFLSRVLFNFL